MGAEGCRGEGFIQQSVGAVVIPHPPLLHDYSSLFIEFSEDRMRHSIGFERSPQRQTIRRKVDHIAGHVLAGRGIEPNPPVTLIEEGHLIARHELSCFFLQFRKPFL